MNIEESKLIILGKAVTDGIIIQGTYGANQFTAQDLMNEKTVSTDTLKGLYSNITQQLEKIPKKSLDERTEKSALTISLERQAEIIEIVYDIRKTIVKERKEKRKEREIAEQKLGVLRHIKTEKELKALEALSDDALDKAIAEAEALTEA